MAFCSKCGAKLTHGAGFCGQCGAPLAAAAAPVAPNAPTTTAPAAGTAMSSNTSAALAYLLGSITGVVFLLSDQHKNNKFVRFHAFQSIFASVAVTVLVVGLAFVVTILSWLSLGLVGLLSLPLWLLLGIALFLLWILLMYKAYTGARLMLPYIGNMAVAAAELPASSPGVEGLLCYILWFITGIVFLVREPSKSDKFVRFHAFQSIFFSAAFIGLSFVWLMVSLSMGVATFGFTFHLMFLVWLVARIGFYAAWISLMSRAYKNEKFMLPVIGAMAEQQAAK